MRKLNRFPTVSQYHPISTGKHAEEKFKDIGEAYEVLSDTSKRAQYDQLVSSGSEASKDRRRHELKPGTIAQRSGRTGEVDFSQFADQ